MTRRRVYDFGPGPAALPREALARAGEDLIDFAGSGRSILEVNHREAIYEAVHDEAMRLLRELLDIPDAYATLLLQGGASLQFGMVPLNFLAPGRHAAYLLTGLWSQRAHAEAARVGDARIAATSERDGRFATVPSDIRVAPDAAYAHLTSNDTLFGVQWRAFPDAGDVPLIADMTSDFLSRRIDVRRFAMIYASAQKNVGCAGVTIVIARRDFLASGRTDLPEVLRYLPHVEKNSLLATAPTFAISVLRTTLATAVARGGVAALEAANAEKAALLYDCIARHPQLYRCDVAPASRSQMTVVFRVPTPALHQAFVEQAGARGLTNLRGNTLIGGLRACIYNWVPLDAVRALVAFMDELAATTRVGKSLPDAPPPP